MNKEKDNNPFSGFTFPIVKNVPAKLISDDITPKTAEEVREELGNLFKEILKKTGNNITMENGDSPIQALNPKKDDE
tara:strand:- start:238 stop:468 length:231 start_codon:yes stop_codon:yes gene_type:complete